MGQFSDCPLFFGKIIMSDKVLIIGITGGIGTGKSEVAKIISDAGFTVLSSDERAKNIMVHDKKVIASLKKQFGNDIYSDDGSVNKEKMSGLIFNSPEAGENISKINSIVHPAVIQDMIDRIEDLLESGEEIIFSESALIFEAGIEEGYDYIIVVDAPEELRIERVKKRSGLSGAQIRARMAMQISQEEKKRLGDFTIVNSGTLDDLKKAVDFVLSLIPTLPPKNFGDLEAFTSVQSSEE